MMVEPAPSDVTRSLHDDPANFVSVPRVYLLLKLEKYGNNLEIPQLAGG